MSETASPSPRSSWLPLTAPSIAWAAQGLLGWWVAAHACAEAGPRRLVWTFPSARWIVGLLAAAALAVTVASLAAALRTLRRHRTAEGSEPAPNDRFGYLGRAGLLVAGTLTLGLFFAGLPALLLVACGVTR